MTDFFRPRHEHGQRKPTACDPNRLEKNTTQMNPTTPTETPASLLAEAKKNENLARLSSMSQTAEEYRRRAAKLRERAAELAREESACTCGFTRAEHRQITLQCPGVEGWLKATFTPFSLTRPSEQAEESCAPEPEDWYQTKPFAGNQHAGIAADATAGPSAGFTWMETEEQVDAEVQRGKDFDDGFASGQRSMAEEIARLNERAQRYLAELIEVKDGLLDAREEIARLKEELATSESCNRRWAAMAIESDDRITAITAVLLDCAKTFREYEALHTAKGTQEGRAKAYANSVMASRCEKALERSGGTK